jgi:hypothetical protein
MKLNNASKSKHLIALADAVSMPEQAVKVFRWCAAHAVRQYTARRFQ